MKNIAKSLAALIVVTAFAAACTPKSEQAQTEAPTESTESVAPADEAPADSVDVPSDTTGVQ